MDHTHVVGGTYGAVAGNIYFTSKVDLGDSTIGLYAKGTGPGTGTGSIELNANGQVVASAGSASFQLTTNLAGESTAMLDGGPLGVVTLANALPIGNAQTVQLDSLLNSIQICNGNVKGAKQTIVLDGLTQSIELSAGGLPVSPTIQMSPTGIKLSMGPANYIEIGAKGITISGLIVDVTAAGQATLEGAMVNVQAKAVTAIKGALVQIQ